jgi:FdhD protein
VGRIGPCGRPGEEGYGNTVDVLPAPGTVLDPERSGMARRGTLTTAACGVCGRRTIDDLRGRCRPVPPGLPVSLSVLRRSVDHLDAHQPNFARTGGIHGAAVVDAAGAMVAAAEDVGRHNAVDKVVGALLREGRIGAGVSHEVPGRPSVLAVSGRVSFEIVQKAAMAGLVAIAAVSAPTSLAVDLAEAMGITLAGFVRGGAMNVYAHPERLP